MKCINCNNEINSNSKFCTHCGYKIEYVNDNNVNMNNYSYNNTQKQTLNNGGNSYNSVDNNLNPKVNNAGNIHGVSSISGNNVDFKTLEGATALFREVNCIGQNCIFLAYKDPLSVQEFLKGVAGKSLLHRQVPYDFDQSNSTVHNLGIGDFSALLINVTENGIGVIPMLQYVNNKVAQLTSTPRFLKPNISDFVFIPKEDIIGITIGRFMGIFKNKCKVVIKVNGGITFNLLIMKKEKLVSYHENNFRLFINKYSS